MNKQQFTEGDRVRLRYGDEVMVVDKVTGTLAVCMTVGPDGKLKTRVYPFSMLVRAEDDPRPAALT